MVLIREYLARAVGVVALTVALYGLTSCGGRVDLQLPGVTPAETGGAPSVPTPGATGGGSPIPMPTAMGGGSPIPTPTATGGTSPVPVPSGTGGVPGTVTPPGYSAECGADPECANGDRCVLGVCVPTCAEDLDLLIPAGEARYLQGVANYCNVIVAGRLEVQPYNGVEGGALKLQARGRIVVLPQGALVADGVGYPSGQGPGAGGCDGGSASGGGYGGPGGAGCCRGLPAPVYGDAPGFSVEMGSGGGMGRGCTEGLGGTGGGSISLFAPEISVFGEISASGTPERTPSMWSPGGGSGGGILLAGSTIDVRGTLSALGGTPSPATWGGGGGGGGRIKLFATTLKLSGKLVVRGGAGGQGTWDGNPGGDGSIYTGS